MVRRWRDRPHCHAYRDSKGATPLARLDNGTSNTRNNGHGQNREIPFGRRDSDSPRRSLTLSPALSLASLQGFDASECESVLTQYMRRIQNLEQEVGQVLHRAPNPIGH